MVKYLLILVNSLALFVYGLFSGDTGVSVIGSIPSTMVAGQATAIELLVKKGEMNGFAKLQMEVPEGFSVTASEEQGATYSFADGVAKWVWATLPEGEEILIKLSLLPAPGLSGAKSITAKYSYVENNVKKVAEMTPAVINVVSSEGLAMADSSRINSAADSLKNALASAVTSNNETPGSVTALRRVEDGSAPNEKVIKITIKKGATRGFARYSDDMPDGVTVKDAKTDGASFSVADGKIKFVWVSVPEKETLEISYTAVVERATAVTFIGEYSYLEDNQSKKFKMEQQIIDIQAEKGKEELAKNDAEKTEETGKKAEGEKEIARNEPEEEKLKPAVVISRSAGNIEYMVQVGAFSKNRSSREKLKKKFNITEEIRSEMHGGYSKYMVGSHEEYKEARDHRVKVWNQNKIKSAFVVAYNHGKRITVQEALMITNQKWFK